MLLEKCHEKHQINILRLGDHFLFDRMHDKIFEKSAIFHGFENIKPYNYFLVMLERLQVTRHVSLHYVEMKKSYFTMISLSYYGFLARLCSMPGKCIKIMENVKKQHFLFSALFKKVKHTKCA